MKTTIITLFLFLAISNSIFSQTKNFIDQPYIETTAIVDTLVPSDRIFMRIVIREKDTKGNVSLEELENKMKNVLTSMKIDVEKKLSVYDLASNFKRYLLRSKDVLKNKTFHLLVENAVTAGKVMLELEKINISNVSIDKISHSAIERVRLELKMKAIIKAKQQAVAMTKPIGQKIGKAIFISDNEDRGNRDLFSDAMYDEINFNVRKLYSGGKEFKPINLQFDKIRVVRLVSVKFILE